MIPKEVLKRIIEFDRKETLNELILLSNGGAIRRIMLSPEDRELIYDEDEDEEFNYKIPKKENKLSKLQLIKKDLAELKDIFR